MHQAKTLAETLIDAGYIVSFHKDHGNLYVSVISKKTKDIKLDFIGFDHNLEESLKKAKEKLDRYEEKINEN